MKRIVLITLVTGLVGCGTSVKNPIKAEIDPDEVVSRIGDISSRPTWLKESEPFRFVEGKVLSLRSTTMPGDQRVEAAMRVAENNAKASIATAIEQKLEYIFQNAEEAQ